MPINTLEIISGTTLTFIDTQRMLTTYVFVRSYRKEYGVILAPEVPRPEGTREDLGAQYATGLVSHLPQKPERHGNRSTDFIAKRDANDRTQRFLSFDGHVLRFQCVEVNGTDTDGFANQLSGMGKRYALHFFLSDETVEMRMLKSKRASVDDATLILKKSRLPKNWRAVQANGVAPEYYTVNDLICGNTVDCYGRVMLLISCDASTRNTFREIGIEQQEVVLPTPEEQRIKHPIPQRGDLFLPIGGEEDTLNTVYGMPKATKNFKKIEEFSGKVIRAKLKMLTNHFVDRSRVFLVSFFLEDDTMQIFEEQQYNGGVVGGQFLKRGKYYNNLPNDSESPRYFAATDIYLGNVISCNGVEFQIYEMDGLSMIICESYPELFPMFDAFKIAARIVYKVAGLREDLRVTLSKAAAARGKDRWMDKELLMQVLEALKLTTDLNDQELLTLVNRVKDKNSEKFYYHELCDLFVNVHFTMNAGSAMNSNKMRSAMAGGRQSEKDAFMKSLRGRRTQWRRYPSSHSPFYYIPCVCTLL